jgi:hypothetical protein
MPISLILAIPALLVIFCAKIALFFYLKDKNTK